MKEVALLINMENRLEKNETVCNYIKEVDILIFDFIRGRDSPDETIPRGALKNFRQGRFASNLGVIITVSV